MGAEGISAVAQLEVAVLGLQLVADRRLHRDLAPCHPLPHRGRLRGAGHGEAPEGLRIDGRVGHRLLVDEELRHRHRLDRQDRLLAVLADDRLDLLDHARRQGVLAEDEHVGGEQGVGEVGRGRRPSGRRGSGWPTGRRSRRARCRRTYDEGQRWRCHSRPRADREPVERDRVAPGQLVHGHPSKSPPETGLPPASRQGTRDPCGGGQAFSLRKTAVPHQRATANRPTAQMTPHIIVVAAT